MAATNLFPNKGNDLRGAAIQLRWGFPENPGGALVSLANRGPVPGFSEMVPNGGGAATELSETYAGRQHHWTEETISLPFSPRSAINPSSDKSIGREFFQS